MLRHAQKRGRRRRRRMRRSRRRRRGKEGGRASPKPRIPLSGKITHHIDVVVLNIVVMADPMQYVDSRIDICVDTDSVQSHANCSTRMFLT